MQRYSVYLLLFFMLLFAGADPLYANKFETISGGVSGMDHEKIDLLKDISLYAGGFLIFLAILALATRNRFEGFLGYSGRGDSSATIKGSVILSVIGTLFIGLSFL